MPRRTEESPPPVSRIINTNGGSSNEEDDESDLSSVGQNGISVGQTNFTSPSIKTLKKRSGDNAASSSSSSTKICIGIIIGAIIIAGAIVGTVIGVTNSNNKNNGSPSEPVLVDPTPPPMISLAQQPTAQPNPNPTSPIPATSIWAQHGNDLDGEAAYDNFGIAVSLSSDGSVLAVGAQYNDGNGDAAGHVRVFEWTGTAWSQRGNDLDGEAAGDRFGQAVTLSSDGSVLAVGAPLNNGNGGNAGHVRVFEWTGTTWSQRGNDLDGEAADDDFGASVSLSSDGSVLAVGAVYNDGNGSNVGHVRVLEWSSTTWSQRGNDLDGEAAGDEFGFAVSLSSDGSVMAVGARENDGNGSLAGHVRVFEWTGTTWSQRGNGLDGEAAGDQFGFAVSLSSDGSVLAVGAIRNDGNGFEAGHVRVFEWTGTTWSQRGNDLDGEAASDWFGYSVSLSSDGSVLAVGALLNDGNGEDAGRVRVFEWTGTTWSRRGNDLDGEAAGDNFGISVSLSSDGSVLAVGAPLNDQNGGSAGHARVFEWTGTT